MYDYDGTAKIPWNYCCKTCCRSGLLDPQEVEAQKHQQDPCIPLNLPGDGTSPFLDCFFSLECLFRVCIPLQIGILMPTCKAIHDHFKHAHSFWRSLTLADYPFLAEYYDEMLQKWSEMTFPRLRVQLSHIPPRTDPKKENDTPIVGYLCIDWNPTSFQAQTYDWVTLNRGLSMPFLKDQRALRVITCYNWCMVCDVEMSEGSMCSRHPENAQLRLEDGIDLISIWDCCTLVPSELCCCSPSSPPHPHIGHPGFHEFMDRIGVKAPVVPQGYPPATSYDLVNSAGVARKVVLSHTPGTTALEKYPFEVHPPDSTEMDGLEEKVLSVLSTFTEFRDSELTCFSDFITKNKKARDFTNRRHGMAQFELDPFDRDWWYTTKSTWFLGSPTTISIGVKFLAISIRTHGKVFNLDHLDQKHPENNRKALSPADFLCEAGMIKIIHKLWLLMNILKSPPSCFHESIYSESHQGRYLRPPPGAQLIFFFTQHQACWSHYN